MPFYRRRVLPIVPCVRGCVLDALRNDGATVYRLPLAEGETERVTVEARVTWPEDTTDLSTLPDPIPAGWDDLTAPPS